MRMAARLGEGGSTIGGYVATQEEIDRFIAAMPSLADIQVLSPTAWVQREKENQQKDTHIKNLELKSYFTVLALQIHGLSQTLSYRKSVADQETLRRYVEWSLIQIAAFAIAWLEKIRKEDSLGG